MAKRAQLALDCGADSPANGRVTYRLHYRTISARRRAGIAFLSRVRLLGLLGKNRRAATRPGWRLRRPLARIDNLRRMAHARSRTLGPRRLQFRTTSARIEQSPPGRKETRAGLLVRPRERRNEFCARQSLSGAARELAREIFLRRYAPARSKSRRRVQQFRFVGIGRESIRSRR